MAHPLQARTARVPLVGLALLLLLVGGPARSQEETAEPARPPFGPRDAAEAEAFFDGTVGIQLRHLNCVGATVALVRNGELLFAKGYGHADLERGIPVDAETTLFRVGSVSKLFVWTAVMQLVEEGRLDLHRDINDYLEGVEVADEFSEPVTLAHLMTHSPGFEDRVVGLFSKDEKSLSPLADLLAAQNPARVRPPGDQPSYSNHGTAMAALIVESVAGRPFDAYVRERILEPLGMEHTALEQPLPARLSDGMSHGYRHAGDSWNVEEFEFVPLYPAGSTSATATDMARLMIAFLGDGAHGDARILEEQTARLMRAPLLEVDPAVNGSPHGFMDMSERGVRIVGHGGDTLWFHTMFAILPDHDLGLFVSYNTDTGAAGRGPLLAAFLDRYLGPAERPGDPPEDFAARADAYTGAYRANRFAHTTLAKLAAAVGAFDVKVNDDGELSTLDGRFIETAPRVFTERDGETTLVFVEGDDGKMSHFYNARFPIVTFERVPASEGKGLHGLLLVAWIAASAGTLIAWPGGWLVRKWFGVRDERAPRISWLARLALWSAAALLLVTVFGFASLMSDPNAVVFGQLGSLKAYLTLPLVALIPAIFAAVAAVNLWRHGRGTRTGRVLYTLAAVLLLASYWQMNIWNVLGFRL